MRARFRRFLATVAVAVTSFARPAAGQAGGFDVSIHSAALSTFFGRDVDMKAEILTPAAYDAKAARRYPTIYDVHSFDRSFRPSYRDVTAWRTAIARSPEPFVVVFLDATHPAGHNEFVDSANDGPWGTALTTEFIPTLERRLHLESNAAGRFLAGHSSGGWSALWLQLTRPTFFGGAWAIAPDPVDFHDFLGCDLTATPPANFYDGPAGARPFVRVRGRDTSTVRAYVREQGARPGGQFDSFDAVFGPRTADGSVVPLFDRRTGAIDPEVARYWEDRFDLAALARRSWPALAPDVAGKLNVFVGTDDTFHLETSVARFAATLRGLGSDARFTFARGRDHWSIFGASGGLIARIVREMTATRATASRASARSFYH
ncbi:MAG: hypothetical protein NVS2B8_14750 [Vulcanimicrobiaceae bacterium]